MRMKITDESVQKLVEKYEKNFIPFEYTPPDTLRNLNASDNIKDLNGYLVLDANAILTPIGETLVEFLNLNFDIFDHFFIFFTQQTKKNCLPFLVIILMMVYIILNIQKN